MKILVLGSTGMLGHQLMKSLSVNHEVVPYRGYLNWPGVAELHTYLARHPTDVIVNCIGIVKQRTDVCAAAVIETNSVLPHDISYAARAHGARLIHFSTDCVFSGANGAYTENDEPDPQDLYGRSKLLGEVYDQGCITLRTSIVGRELRRRSSIVEWFLSQPDRSAVPGFITHRFNGLTTIEMARVVERVLHSPDAHGVWHVGSAGISKFQLLQLLRHYYRKDVAVVAVTPEHCDRSLDSTRFQRYFGYTPPSWDDMIREMANAER